MLPERIPLEIYLHVGGELGWTPALVRAIARQESWDADEDPRWPRWEKSRWLRYRMASREAKAFDKYSNSASLPARWAAFEAMDRICQSDGEINPSARDAAVLSHSVGMGSIMGDEHKFAGHETARAFWEAMKTMDGQARCFIAFARSSSRLLELGRRLDTTQRRITLKGADHLLKFGDLSEISAIWNGANYEQNQHDVGLGRHLAFAREQGFNVRAA